MGLRGLIFFALVASLTSSCGIFPKNQRAKKESTIKFEIVEAPGLQLFDDLKLSGLSEVLEVHIGYWKHPSRVQKSIQFGNDISFSAQDYLQLLKKLKKIVSSKDKQKIREFVNTHFQFVGAVADKKPAGWTFATSYYEPMIQASLRRTDLFSQPLYGVPKNLVNVQMGEFAGAFPHWSIWETQNTEQKSKSPVLRGRLTPPIGPLGISSVVPFYSRAEIDEKGVLQGEAKIFGYVHPLDSFFLQIQGSGVLQFSKGSKIRVGYAAQNGHPYSAIGRYMFDVIPRRDMSLQTIREYLLRLPEEEMWEFLNRNRSYVFFRKLDGRGETYMGTEVVDGRTIATDYRIFPKGVLALLSFESPTMEGESIKVSRLVMDQDTGGAIRGPHRVDLFWGQGDGAEAIAGQIKTSAQILYLAPRQGALKALHQ